MKLTFLVVLIVLLDMLFTFSKDQATGWKDIQKSTEGMVTVYWFANSSFFY